MVRQTEPDDPRRRKLGRLSPRERELLQVIEDNCRLVMPSNRELCRLMGIRSKGTISKMFEHIRAKGYLPE